MSQFAAITALPQREWCDNARCAGIVPGARSWRTEAEIRNPPGRRARISGDMPGIYRCCNQILHHVGGESKRKILPQAKCACASRFHAGSASRGWSPMPSRKNISKRARFDVFKRDLFTCQYCGRKPPAVVLEVDHVVPVSGGGSSDEHNLLTSCFDCNRGKSNGTLEANPINVEKRRERLKARQEQTKAYEELLRAQREDMNAKVDDVVEFYDNAFEKWTLNDRARASIRRFLDLLPHSIVAESMEYACARMNEDRAFRYFCGICWRRIKGD
jgi:hypothetical protein